MKCDFSGYATKNDLRCTDGRTIRRGAFSECDGVTVPLVWQHMHRSADNVLGHAELEERDDGMYAYCTLNETENGKTAKELVRHGDVRSLSIYANQLRQNGGDVIHGMIREVSLVLSGANPGARIDNVSFAHSDGTYEEIDDEAIISPGEGFFLMHADEEDDYDDEEDDEGDEGETVEDVFNTLNDKQKKAVYAIIGAALEDKDGESVAHADDDEPTAHEAEEGEEEDENDEETIKDVFDTLTDKQKKAVYAIIGAALEDKDGESVAHADEEYDDEDEEGEEEDENDEETIKDVFDTLTDKQKKAVYAIVGAALEDQANGAKEMRQSDIEGDYMKFNVFDQESNDTNVLTHSDMEAIFAEAPRVGSLRDAVLEHGITDIEVLFPEAQVVNNEPYMISRRMEWVSTVLNGVHKSPFSRIKSTAANLTEAQARAKGYIKGRKKIEEQITALRRITTPQTVYKLQKIDRDDVIDITDFDVVAWMKQEMRMMLDEELARAILVGDGRPASDPEKIYEDHIRPVWSDSETYTIHQVVAAADGADYEKIMDDIVRSRKGYKGSGNPVMFIGSDMLTEMRLLKDNDGRFRYDSDQKLAEALRVSKIEEVELFDDLVRTVESKDRKLVAIILNLMDYTVGANKGGEVNLFDDFDLDYNKLEYLIETRVSGALTMPKSAIAVEIQTTTTSTPETTYVRVTTPATADIGDYYEQDEYGRYIKTVDVAVIPGKVYYEIEE